MIANLLKSKYTKSVIVLAVVCLVSALLLAVVNFITAPVIDAAEKEATNKALREVRAGANEFTALDLSAYTDLDASITEGYSDDLGGYVFKMSTTGFNPGLVVLVGIDENGVVVGAKCLASGETLGAEKTYGDNTVGADLDSIDGVATVSGVTKTTLGYRNAVKAALEAAKIVSEKGE